MFSHEHWYIAAFRRDVTDKPTRAIVLGEPVVLYRTPEGEAVALEDRCVHREVPLSMGSCQPDGSLQCAYHGMRFDRRGRCTHIPEQTRIPAEARVRCYPIAEAGEWVWVWMGDPARAVEALIPDYSWFKKPGWRTRVGHIHVKCGYKLLVDNLLNMSHLPFVHPRTIGGEGVIKDAKISVDRKPNGVRLSRRMYDIDPPPTYQTAAGFEGKVNRWQTIDFLAPCYFEFDTGVIDAGHAIPDPNAPTDTTNGVKMLSRHSMHAVVPEAEQTANYFVGFAYDPQGMTEDMADFVFDSVYKTFLEDVDILEAQQANMRLAPGRARVDMASDAAGLHALRIIDALENGRPADIKTRMAREFA
jgi:phenylpropionate dioxygenase-like ring-hydroxylating dioxygenase large terminal subunit